jgi:hypothetical protein
MLNSAVQNQLLLSSEIEEGLIEIWIQFTCIIFFGFAPLDSRKCKVNPTHVK